MKTKNGILLISMLLLVTLTAQSCWFDWLKDDDDDNKLPAITQSGKDTFGCLVDGKVWLPKGELLYFPRTRVNLEWNNDSRRWHIAANKRPGGLSFYIPEDNLHEGNVNITVDQENILGIYFSWEENYPDENFTWNEDLEGELVVSRLDTINKIVAGTFWFDLTGDKGSKIQIRDGRFDLKINTIEP